ncbi:MAG TPA: fluoride efflux transporter CrcB [Gammaproteobacteria bacterium]|nr:fluoride efflux transporter CrcB [Gammaproteobacteria bacterium]
MWNYVAVALGGALGCCARYGVTQAVQLVYGRNFPLATLIVNVLGCLLMGFLFFLTLDRISISPTLRMAILTGGLGGFTTFSTFAMETLLLIEDGETGYAVSYLVLSVMLGLAAALLGAYIARNL